MQKKCWRWHQSTAWMLSFCSWCWQPLHGQGIAYSSPHLQMLLQTCLSDAASCPVGCSCLWSPKTWSHHLYWMIIVNRQRNASAILDEIFSIFSMAPMSSQLKFLSYGFSSAHNAACGPGTMRMPGITRPCGCWSGLKNPLTIWWASNVILYLSTLASIMVVRCSFPDVAWSSAVPTCHSSASPSCSAICWSFVCSSPCPLFNC